MDTIMVIRNALVVLVGDLVLFDDEDFSHQPQFRMTRYGFVVTFGRSRIVIERYRGALRFLARSRTGGVCGCVTEDQLTRLQSFLEGYQLITLIALDSPLLPSVA